MMCYNGDHGGGAVAKNLSVRAQTCERDCEIILLGKMMPDTVQMPSLRIYGKTGPA